LLFLQVGNEHPAISEKRLSLTPSGNIRYQLKTPYSDGTPHVIFEPLDFIAKLAALVPKPRVNLTRRIRAQQQTPGRCDAGQTRQRLRPKGKRRQNTRTVPPGYDLGTAFETGIQH
jgi:hypothetical protein